MFLVTIIYTILLYKCSAQCPLEYSVIEPSHSYCAVAYPDVKDHELSLQQRNEILEMHNHERRLVSGTNMQKMYWNNDLADIALHYARTCRFAHDTGNQRSVPKIPLSTGQNLAMGYENWTKAVDAWIREKEHYFYGRQSTGMVGHYIQMIWHSAALVGCASTTCPPYGSYPKHWPFYVCNYITIHLHPDYHKPYEQGYHNQPLHDCQGKVCLYNGTLDLNTCECKCSTYATGTQCERLDCSIAPPCPDYLRNYCDAFNIPSQCPIECGLCDRYEVLKYVYGEYNLSPTIISTKPTTVLPDYRTSYDQRFENTLPNPEENIVINEDYIFSVGTQISSRNIFYTTILLTRCRKPIFWYFLLVFYFIALYSY